MLMKAYCEHVLGRTQRNEWFNTFKSDDFGRNKKCGRPQKKVEDGKLQALLN